VQLRATAGRSSAQAAATARALRHFDARAEAVAGGLTPRELAAFRHRFLQHTALLAARRTLPGEEQDPRDMKDQEPPFDVEKADLEKALHEQQPAVTEQFAKNVQAKAKGWKAGNPEWAANLSMSEAKHLMGHIDDPTLERVPEDSLGAFAGSGMPESFDTREAWPKCKEIISHVRDQGKCGSCWAFAAANTMDGRLCIATDGRFSGPRAFISAGYFASCYNINTPVMGNINGCDGGNPGSALQSASRSLFGGGGVPTGSQQQNTCVPWFGHGNALSHFFDNSMKAPACPKDCTSKYGYPRTVEADKFYPSGKVQVTDNFWDLKSALVQGGPVPFALAVYKDFMLYMGGYYDRTTDERIGDHAATAIGYETHDGKGYVVGMNSWGHMWGDGTGIFKLEASCCQPSYYLPQIDGDQSALPLPGDQTDPTSDEDGASGGSDHCPTSTGGTCYFFKCFDSRGPTRCKLGQCQCQVGHCAMDGRCIPVGNWTAQVSIDETQPGGALREDGAPQEGAPEAPHD